MRCQGKSIALAVARANDSLHVISRSPARATTLEHVYLAQVSTVVLYTCRNSFVDPVIGNTKSALSTNRRAIPTAICRLSFALGLLCSRLPVLSLVTE